MTTLLMATYNPGKFEEYIQIFEGIPLTFTSLREKGINLLVEECGRSYAENSILKARAYARASGLLTLADDSGLEVKALDGQPGIFSSRYGGMGLSDEDRYRLLLERMKGIPWEERRALFRCVIALATPQGQVETAEGICEGVIAFAPQGEHGFGYDPIFYLPQYGRTMAQLEPGVKNRISHRARAASKIRGVLERLTLSV